MRFSTLISAISLLSSIAISTTTDAFKSTGITSSHTIVQPHFGIRYHVNLMSDTGTQCNTTLYSPAQPIVAAPVQTTASITTTAAQTTTPPPTAAATTNTKPPTTTPAAATTASPSTQVPTH